RGGLDVVRIHAARRRVDDLLDAGAVCGCEDETVKHQIRRTRHLVEVDIAPAAVVGCQVEDDLHPVDRPIDDALIGPVALAELDGAGLDVRADVVEPATAQVIDDPYAGPALDECVDEVRSDEGRASGDERPAITPLHSLLSSAARPGRPTASR